MQISCVNYKKLDQGTRLDAEYYKPEFLEVEKILWKANCKLLDDVSKSIKSFGAYALCNKMVLVAKGIPFIRCKDIKKGFVDFSEVLFIDEATHCLLSKSAITPNIVMLTMSGSVGNSAIADPTWKYPINSNQDIAKIETDDLINPYYLTVFFNTKYGKSQTERLPIGSIQQHIFLWQLKGLLIFTPSSKLQGLIAGIYCKVIKLLKDSDFFYQKAEQILLFELGLLNWKPKRRLSFVKNFSETQTGGRIDAEYFQPMYEEIVDKISKRFNAKPIGEYNFIDVTTGQYSDNYTEKLSGLPYIRGTDLLSGTVKMDNLVYIAKEHQEKSKLAREGDVVVTRVGTIGLSARIPKECEGGTISDNLIRLRIKDDGLDTYFLALFLDSILGRSLMIRYSRGSVQQRLNQETLKEIIIPILDRNIQANIALEVKDSHKLREQSRCLLDIAKRGVEMAIEKSEKDAQNWIDEELRKLNFRVD
ncbi:restriction endonuclease subunit S [bacterium]|nr:restriction endonuclease subunit S [bacterium]RQV92074.1 MAG: hypothetical protein EH221_12380 [bacterium]